MGKKKWFGLLPAVVLLAMGLAPAVGEDVLIRPSTDQEGFAGVSGWVNANAILYVGDVDSGSHLLRTVLKFPLEAITDEIGQAKITARCVGVTSSSMYFVLEHFTVQNGSPVGPEDAVAASVERVGGVIPAAAIDYEWDVTDYVKTDKQAGWTHSAFRLIQTDSSGNYVTDNGGQTVAACFASQEYGDPATAPALRITYAFPVGTEIIPPADMQGFAGVSGWVAANTVIYVGDVNADSNLLRAVFKFPLVAISREIGQVKLAANCNYLTTSPFYFVVEHYTYQNNSSIGQDDATTLNVERVGGVITAATTAYEWDVTPYVKADKSAGWSHSAFRLVQTDSSGNYITNNYGAGNAAVFNSLGYGGATVAPTLKVTYTAGPVTVSGSVGLSGYRLENQWLWLGNVGSVNHLFRGIVKFPIQTYTQPVTSALLYGNVSYVSFPEGDTANYFVVEHYTYANNGYLAPQDASTDQVERVGGVELARVHHTYAWDVTPYVEHDRAAGWTHSAFRFALTDAAGNYLPDTAGQVKCIYFDNNCQLVVSTSTWPAALSRGHKILLDRGLQLQGQTFPLITNGFDLTRWQASHFSTVNFQWETVPHFLGIAPGSAWGRWVRTSAVLNTEEIASEELPYLSNLVSVQIDDEQNFMDPAIVTDLQEWRTKAPKALGFTNQTGGEVTDPRLSQYMAAAQPDMIMFDHYLDSFGPGGSPTALYETMQIYRQRGLAGNDGSGATPIPYALYTQTFTNGGDYTHALSDSEMRLNQFAAWTFGYKFISAFVYDSPNCFGLNSILFTGLGDANPTAAFAQMAETNRQSKNLGPALVRLLSTDVRMIMGQHDGGAVNDTPSNVTTGIAGADPYLTGVTATNNGSKNNGRPGDVIVGFFKVLDESFDGTAYTNEKYFMVTNGLSDAAGTAAETRQTIHLTFNVGSSGITSLLRLSRSTGQGEMVPLVHDSGSLYHLDLVLDGGTGDLFKYNTGAPFVGIGAIIIEIPGDANRDGKVDVSDLGILAANYGMTTGATWDKGDFNRDGKVDVSDLGILAANYGTGTGTSLDFNQDAQTLGLAVEAKQETPVITDLGCGSAGLPLMAGLFLMGLFLTRLDEE